MPLIRPDALPLDAQEVNQIRARLSQPFQFELVRRDDVQCLFVRSDRAEPDPINDLETALNEIPDWALGGYSDVVLLGEHQNFHVPARAANAIVERRQRIDLAALQALRAGLDPHYGVGLHRVAGDPANALRLGMRIPRRSVREIDDPDLNKLAQAIGPSLTAGELRHVRTVYLVAEEDHLRMRGEDVIADLGPRWHELQRTPPASAPVFVPAEPAPTPEPLLAPPPRAARARPKRTIRVKPIVDLEDHLDAIGVEEKDRALLEEAETQLNQRLLDAGYDVLRSVEHAKVLYALAAERATGYPRRVLVRSLRRVERTDADQLLHAVRELEADLLVCVATSVADAAHRRLVATKVKVLDPREANAFRL